MPTKLSRARIALKASSARAAQRVPGVHGAQDGEVGVGVEPIDEALTLIVEVAGDIESPADQAQTSTPTGLRPRGSLRRVPGWAVRPKRSSNSVCGLVAEHGDLARQRQAAARRLMRQIAPAGPFRVVEDGLALEVVEREAHGRERRHADDERAPTRSDRAWPTRAPACRRWSRRAPVRSGGCQANREGGPGRARCREWRRAGNRDRTAGRFQDRRSRAPWSHNRSPAD